MKEHKTLRINGKTLVYAAAALTILAWIPMAVSKNVAYDPGFSVAMTQHGFGEIIRLCALDVHSPLYYFIAKVFFHLLFQKIFALKICSLFFMIAYIWMIAFPVRKEFGNRIAFYMILLSALLPTFITHATEPRMYTMTVMSYSAVVFLAYLIIKKPKIAYMIAFFIMSVFSTYIHTYTMLACVLLYLFLAVYLFASHHEEKKKLIIWFLINALAVSVAYLPWLFSLISQFKEKTAGDEMGYDLKYFLRELAYELFSTNDQPVKWHFIVWCVALSVCFVLLLVKKSKMIYPMILGMVFITILSVIGISISMKNIPCYMGRYIICLMPVVLFGAAAGMGSIKKQWINIILLLILLIPALFVYRNRMNQETDKGIDEYIECMSENVDADDAIMYAGIHVNYLEIFFDSPYSYIYGYSPAFNPFFTDEVFTSTEQLDKVKGDLYLVCSGNVTPEWFFDNDYDSVLNFHFLYYDFGVYRIIRNGDSYL